ncbi:MAG: aminoglycoside 6-adenylyltransferase [Cyclobacteriaceae bacterium]|nr:aminoglycoside 6-adenylyltransferase [Cyclobacteriaceae bacterium]
MTLITSSKRPTEQEFIDTCNEFWWVSTYIIKGLLRDEITYAKEMGETIVRPMFMKIIEWYIGTETDFSVSLGTGGRHINNYLKASLYRNIFGELSAIVASKLNLQHNIVEAQNVKLYLMQSYEDFKIIKK